MLTHVNLNKDAFDMGYDAGNIKFIVTVMLLLYLHGHNCIMYFCFPFSGPSRVFFSIASVMQRSLVCKPLQNMP